DTAVMYDKDRTGERLSTDTPVDVDEIGAWTETSAEQQPVINEPDLQKTGVELRGNDSMSVYRVPQDIMFDTDKAQIRPEGEDKLKKIADNIKKRQQQREGNVEIYIYGHTDARASKPYNKELGRDRAQSVADWMTSKGGFDRSKLTVKSMGETQPEATNQTAEGMQQNRRVEIVVRNR
ncbi:MAG: OmpA family protein, partial [Hymenobacteraceae bacterium]|nr:OmpA family protein [Hymenobacteraceae bacterium]